MFPGVGKFTGCETGVDKIEKDVADGIETKPENLDADTVRTGGRGVLHREENGPEGMKGDRLQGESASTHPGQPAGKIRGLPLRL